MGNCVASGGATTVTAAGEDGRRRGRRWKAPREEQLGSVPGRIFSNDGRSRTAAVFTQQGRKGVNQDAMLVWDVSHRISRPSLTHSCPPVPPRMVVMVVECLTVALGRGSAGRRTSCCVGCSTGTARMATWWRAGSATRCR
jgi:hypothetical protein